MSIICFMYRLFPIHLILLIHVNDISLEIYYRQLSWILYTVFLLHVSLKRIDIQCHQSKTFGACFMKQSQRASFSFWRYPFFFNQLRYFLMNAFFELFVILSQCQQLKTKSYSLSLPLQRLKYLIIYIHQAWAEQSVD